MVSASRRRRQAKRALATAGRLSLVATFALLCGAAAAAGETVYADAGCMLRDGPTGIVAEVIDAVSLRLEGGAVIRLAGVLPAEGTEAAAGDAVTFLEDLTLGRSVRLGYGAVDTDRYGRATGQLFLAGAADAWVQAELVGAGFAIVAGSAADRTCLGDLLAYERQARAAGLGLWAGHPVPVAGAPGLTADLPRFELVEGRVISIGRTERTVYLNFGYDWSVDFTVTIEAATAAAIESEGGPFDRLVGQKVRIRGWLRQWNGPWIAVDHAEQIEVLDEDDGGV